MPYKQIKEIVDHVRILHGRLRDALRHGEVMTDDPRSEVLLTSIERDEEAIRNGFGDYLVESSDNVLETWIQYVPDDEVVRQLEDFKVTAEMPPDEIVERKQEFDNALLKLYQSLADQAPTPKVRDWALAQVEWIEFKKRQDSWSLLDLEDSSGRTSNVKRNSS